MRRFIVVLVGALILGSCAVFGPPAATFQEGVELLPGPGYFHVVGDPPEAASDIIVRWFGQDGEESGVSASFRAGANIDIDGTAFEGSEGLTVDGEQCGGRFPIKLDHVTEVTLHISDADCDVTFGAVTPVVVPEHEATATPATTIESSPSTSESWGPMAVVPPQPGTDTLRLEGTLVITDACVFVERTNGDQFLLLWPADRSAWDAATRTITFRNVDETIAAMKDGDQVVLGGGGDSREKSGATFDDWLARLRWVAQPGTGCLPDQWWIVGIVQG